MNFQLRQSGSVRFNRIDQLKCALVASFVSSAESVEASLLSFSAGEWQRIVVWLDISGLALYVFDRLSTLQLQRLIPEQTRLKLEENLIENRERTQHLFSEACAISHKFESNGVRFALLKGITLAPDSVPDCALRVQTDLDYLVDMRDATTATRVLGDAGYWLHAISRSTIEFRAGTLPKPDMRNMYRVHSCRALEVHMIASSANGSPSAGNRLTRARGRCFRSVPIPALSPADMLVQQAIHLFKHLCGEHTRASWVLEFWRHVQTRRDDAQFWMEVEEIIGEDGLSSLALAASAYLASLIFEDPALNDLNERMVNCLPSTVRLWIETYGVRELLASKPGSKRYLILRRLLESETESRPARRRLLFPFRLPPRITNPIPGESLASRINRYSIEARYLFSRAAFHVIEGMKYAIEVPRWQKRMEGLTK